jgi:outer membrane protein assembly factor BamD
VRLRAVDRSAPLLMAALLMAALGTGCRSHRGDDAKSGPEVIYSRAEKSMKNGDFGQAIKQLEALQSRFPFSDSARQAQLDLIYDYYRNHEVDPAVDAADTFIRENPTNGRVDYAYYMKGLVYFERQANFLERWFGADLSARPPTNAKKSFDAFQSLLQKYPHSEYAADARQRMIYLRNRLANFELHVAQYYMRRGAYVGAINRAKFCIENYDGAPAVQPSLAVLIEAYRKLHMDDLAASAQKVYADNYPGDSRLVEQHRAWWKFF